MSRAPRRPSSRAPNAWAPASWVTAGGEVVWPQALVATTLIGLLTLTLPQRETIHWPWAVAILLSMLATATLSLLPPVRRLLTGFTAPLFIVQVGALVAVTGGSGSPYIALHGMLLLYAAIVYGTRRLLLIGGLVAAVTMVSYLLAPDANPAGRGTGLVVQLAVWAVVSAVVHALIQALVENHRRLAVSEQQYRSLFENNTDAVFSLDCDGRFTSVNQAACRLVGRSADEIVGADWVPLVPAEEHDLVSSSLQTALAGTPICFQTTVRDRSGRTFPVTVTNMPILIDGRTVGVFGVARDVSESVALQAALTRQALYDPLTGASNRLLYEDRLALALADIPRKGSPVALLLLDLDDFKRVNDGLGHAAGDAVLVELVQRLTGSVRAGDTVSRLGGDEFAVVLPGSDACAAHVVSERIRRRLETAMRVDGHELTVHASIGVAVADSPEITADALQRQADAAMYRTKRERRGDAGATQTDEPSAQRVG